VINVLTVRNLYCVVKTDLNVWTVPVASSPQLAVSRDEDGLLFSFRVQKKNQKNLAVKGTCRTEISSGPEQEFIQILPSLFFNLVLLDMRPQIMLYFQKTIIAILKSFCPVICTSSPHLFTFKGSVS
jgi:hypothetical protein